MSETDPDRTPGVAGVLDAVRDGWHSLGGGDAAACPGCPVCRLSESAGRLDPETAAHLQQAVGHVVSAGRELLAALATQGRPAQHTAPPAAPGTPAAAPGTGAPERPRTPGTGSSRTGTGRTSTDGPSGVRPDRLADPSGPSFPTRTRIPVHTPPTSPRPGNEEQE